MANLHEFALTWDRDSLSAPSRFTEGGPDSESLDDCSFPARASEISEFRSVVFWVVCNPWYAFSVTEGNNDLHVEANQSWFVSRNTAPRFRC